MTLVAGTKLGRYEIRSQLGKGGMGEVYLAEDTRLHRKVALKVLPVEVAANQERMRRFNQEAVASTRSAGPLRTSSSAEYIAGEIKRHKIGAAIVALLVVAVTTVGLGYYLHAKNSKVAIDSIAVLPFTSTTGDQEMEYLSDGISESLINSLSQLPGLRVIAQDSRSVNPRSPKGGRITTEIKRAASVPLAFRILAIRQHRNLTRNRG